MLHYARMYCGDTELKRLYCGDELIWEKGAPEPSYDETKVAVVVLDENDEPTDDVKYFDLAHAIGYVLNVRNNNYLVRIGTESGITNIDDDFSGAQTVKRFDIPDTVAAISATYAFASTGIKSITLPDRITQLPHSTFLECRYLEVAHLPNNLVQTDGGTFAECTMLKTVNVPNTWTLWNGAEFRNCSSLKKILLPNVRAIGDADFLNCKSLENIIIPNSVIYIRTSAFKGCDSFTEIIIPENVVEINAEAFARNADGNKYPICINKACNSISGSPWGAEDYNIHWAKKVGIYSASNDGRRDSFITNVDTLALAIDYLNSNSSGMYCLSCGDTSEESTPVVQMKTALYGLFLSGSSMALNIAAFAGNSNLRYISIGIGVQTIPISCFASCESLTTVYIGKNVETISDNAFAGCSTLQSITIPANVEQVSASAFSGCFGLTSITVNKPENSISGAPWGAPHATVVWTG